VLVAAGAAAACGACGDKAAVATIMRHQKKAACPADGWQPAGLVVQLYTAATGAAHCSLCLHCSQALPMIG
jgi:hypothetical protein